jgi:hypothetical protein
MGKRGRQHERAARARVRSSVSTGRVVVREMRTVKVKGAGGLLDTHHGLLHDEALGGSACLLGNGAPRSDINRRHEQSVDPCRCSASCVACAFAAQSTEPRPLREGCRYVYLFIQRPPHRRQLEQRRLGRAEPAIDINTYTCGAVFVGNVFLTFTEETVDGARSRCLAVHVAREERLDAAVRTQSEGGLAVRSEVADTLRLTRLDRSASR